MPVSVTMPRLGESVSEGTVTRWLKQEGDPVAADEPLLEVSTDKVDTEIPAPASGVLSSIKVAEDETVEVGVELAIISADGEAAGTSGDVGYAGAAAGEPAGGDEGSDGSVADPSAGTGAGGGGQASDAQASDRRASDGRADGQEPGGQEQGGQEPARSDQEIAAGSPAGTEPAETGSEAAAEPAATPSGTVVGEGRAASADPAASGPAGQGSGPAAAAVGGGGQEQGGPTAYVTPLVRKLAAEHGVDLHRVTGTGVGGRIRKQDVVEAARSGAAADGQARTVEPPPTHAAADDGGAAIGGQRDTADNAPAGDLPDAPAAATSAPRAQPNIAQAQSAAGATHVRGRTEKLSRLRTVIAKRMTESLQTSAQLTTVVEVDITRIARLRALVKDEFAQREGVPLSYLPFFAVAACEALKNHPSVNSSVDMAAGTVTYHEAVHLGVAVDTDRGLLVPVIHQAGDLNLAGLARNIYDLADRTRRNAVSPDELGGGTFTLTNTGSRGALFDTPIINQPQVAILGTGTVVKRPAVVVDPELGEVIAVRSMVYLALTYDHRIVDGADAARFLVTIKERLEAGAFEGDLGR